MRTTVIAMVLCVGLCVTTLSGGTGQGEETSVSRWGPTSRGCRLSIQATQPSFRYDQPIRVELILANVGEKPVRIFEEPVMVMYRIQVKSPDGEAAPLTAEGQRQMKELENEAARRSITINPGKTFSDRIVMLNRLYDMTIQGEYTVTISVLNVAVLGTADKSLHEVVSNTLTTRVVDKDTTTQSATTRS